MISNRYLAFVIEDYFSLLASMHTIAGSMLAPANDVVTRGALQARRTTIHHAMGGREGILRDAPALQAALARGAQQHRLPNPV